MADIQWTVIKELDRIGDNDNPYHLYRTVAMVGGGFYKFEAWEPFPQAPQGTADYMLVNTPVIIPVSGLVNRKHHRNWTGDTATVLDQIPDMWFDNLPKLANTKA